MTNKHVGVNGVGVGVCQGVKNKKRALHLNKEMRMHLNAQKMGNTIFEKC